MRPSATISRAIMNVACCLAPATHNEWTQAMREEFEALNGSPNALAWAVGCLGATARWRVRNEVRFTSTFMAVGLAVALASGPLFFFIIDWSEPRGLSWMATLTIVQALIIGVSSLVLAFAWPRRAVVIGLLMPLTWGFGSVPHYLAGLLQIAFQDPWLITNPNGVAPMMPAIFTPVLFLVGEIWPGLIGAALGWGMAKTWRIGAIANRGNSCA